MIAAPKNAEKKRTEDLKSDVLDKRICDCPVETALNLISGKWKARILWKLHTHGVVRFGEMRKGLEGITQKMLTQQLRELEDDGLIKRKVYAEVPPRVEYSLTSFGQTLQPVMQVIGEWGKEHNKRIVKALKR
jgi:DNA-binding HxlR family transcriptional regulator